jgi:DNA replication and repair protein RecF
MEFDAAGPEANPAPWIRRLQVQRFRNLAPLDLHLKPGAHFLFGRTGQGKTSLLEAVYLLATSRSFRTARLEHCVHKVLAELDSERSHGTATQEDVAPGIWLAADIETLQARVRLELTWSPGEGVRRRINGDVVSAAEFLDVLPVVVWSSGDLETLVGPPERRRRMLDRAIVTLRPVALRCLTTYRRTLEQKRHLLAQHRPDREQLRSWNELLAAAGSELIQRRLESAMLLDQALEEAGRDLGLGWAPLRLRYRPQPEGGEERASFLSALEEAGEEEIRRRRPLLGPHLDRVVFEWQGSPLEQIASAGERKAHGLVLTRAQVRILQAAGRAPILLLDDLDTELDTELLSSFLPLLTTVGQSFLTSNRPQVFDQFLSGHGWSEGLSNRDPEDGRARQSIGQTSERSECFSWLVEAGQISSL